MCIKTLILWSLPCDYHTKQILCPSECEVILSNSAKHELFFFFKGTYSRHKARILIQKAFFYFIEISFLESKTIRSWELILPILLKKFIYLSSSLKIYMKFTTWKKNLFLFWQKKLTTNTYKYNPSINKLMWRGRKL